MRKWLYQLTVASMVCLSMASVALAQNPKKQGPSATKQQSSSTTKQQSSSTTKPHRLLIHVDQNDPAVMKSRAKQRHQRDRLLPRQGRGR